MDSNTASALAAPPPVRMMPPTQALRSGFDMGGKTEGAESGKAKRDSLSHRALGESRQGFRIGELRLLIRYADASELAEVSAIHRLPNVPDWFRGVANFHGRLTPVFDLARYLGVEPAAEAKHMLLVLSSGADAAGVLIDGLPERLHWSGEQHTTDASAAPARLVPHLRGALQLGGHEWFDLDTQSLLGAIEQSLGEPQ